MKRLIIVGAGGHGSVIADTAVTVGQWREIAFLDDKYPEITKTGVWPVLGTTHSTEQVDLLRDDIVVGIGDNAQRLELIRFFQQNGYRIASVIHPGAFVSQRAEIREGTVIFANAVINYGGDIGRGCIINTAATVDHDCVLGEGVHISPGAHLAGAVRVERCAWIGMSACVIQGVSIGESSIIGAGSVVITDVPDQVTVVGCPGRIVRYSSGLTLQDEN